MGQREVGFIQRHIVIGDDVDIGRARPVSLFMGTIPAEPQFNLLRALQKLARLSVVSTAMARLTKCGWYLKPHGGVR